MVRLKQPVIEASVWPQAKDLTNLAQTYVDVDAVLAASVDSIFVHNTSAVSLILATGAAGSEVPFFIAPPLQSVMVPTENILIKGVRLSYKAVNTTIASGYFTLNGFKG